MTSTPKEKWSSKDIAGLGFSTAALALSLISFYISNLKVEDSVVARIVDARSGTDAPETNAGNDYGAISLTISFVNNGNRPSIIIPPSYFISDDPDKKGKISEGFDDNNKKQPPILLQPADIKVLSLTIPIIFIRNNFDDIGSKKFYAGLNFQAIGSSGDVEQSSSGTQIEITFISHKISTILSMKRDRNDNNSEFIATQLFAKARRRVF